MNSNGGIHDSSSLKNLGPLPSLSNERSDAFGVPEDIHTSTYAKEAGSELKKCLGGSGEVIDPVGESCEDRANSFKALLICHGPRDK